VELVFLRSGQGRVDHLIPITTVTKESAASNVCTSTETQAALKGKEKPSPREALLRMYAPAPGHL